MWLAASSITFSNHSHALLPVWFQNGVLLSLYTTNGVSTSLGVCGGVGYGWCIAGCPQFVSPELLMLRVWARYMIMWVCPPTLACTCRLVAMLLAVPSFASPLRAHDAALLPRGDRLRTRCSRRKSGSTASYPITYSDHSPTPRAEGLRDTTGGSATAEGDKASQKQRMGASHGSSTSRPSFLPHPLPLAPPLLRRLARPSPAPRPRATLSDLRKSTSQFSWAAALQSHFASPVPSRRMRVTR